jgi:hypothetical protein
MYGDEPKYVIVEDGGHEMAIVFNPILDHTFVVGPTTKVVAAGRVYIGDTGDVAVRGESVKLESAQRNNPNIKGFKSRPEDEFLIKQALDLPR